jgi:hypothetical protein
MDWLVSQNGHVDVVHKSPCLEIGQQTVSKGGAILRRLRVPLDDRVLIEIKLADRGVHLEVNSIAPECRGARGRNIR